MTTATATTVLRGIGVSEGVGRGRIFPLPGLRVHAAGPAAGARAELARYHAARDRVRERFHHATSRLARVLGGKGERLLDAHALILQDPVVDQEIALLIRTGKRAEAAVEEFFRRMAERQRSVTNPYLRDRFTIPREIGVLLANELSGARRMDAVLGQGDVIVAARELTPLAFVDCPENVKGVALEIGSPTSHTAILARSYRIPMVIGLRDVLRAAEADAPALIDGGSGELVLHPGPATLERYAKRRAAAALTRALSTRAAAEPSVTKDGRRVALLANVDPGRGFEEAERYGAEGAGLVRSELLFMHHGSPVDEEQQAALLRRVAEAFGRRKAVVRTADFGGDKPAPAWLAGDGEADAGLRGVRLCLAHRGFFKAHLRAILRASAFGRLGIMFPMVPGLGTFREAKAVLREAMQELSARGVAFDGDIPIGLMIEVPSAAIMAGALAREADFLSIGTNDLLPYTLGMDRGEPARRNVSLPPSILHLLQIATSSARRWRRPISVCGELAGESWAMPLFVGLGIQELSMEPSRIPQARRTVRSLSYAECRRLAGRVLRLETTEEVRRALQ